jgi:hypothetical protein
MPSDQFRECNCCADQADDSETISREYITVRLISDAARRLLEIFNVADVLTEKPDLTETDLIALDVLLIAGRDNAEELIWQIEQLKNPLPSVEAKPRC